MEAMTILLAQDAIYDHVVHRGSEGKPSLLQASAITLVTKDRATQQGKAGAVIAFEVQAPDGSIRTAQAVVTVRILTSALAALRGRYGDDGTPPGPAPGTH